MSVPPFLYFSTVTDQISFNCPRSDRFLSCCRCYFDVLFVLFVAVFPGTQHIFTLWFRFVLKFAPNYALICAQLLLIKTKKKTLTGKTSHMCVCMCVVFQSSLESLIMSFSSFYHAEISLPFSSHHLVGHVFIFIMIHFPLFLELSPSKSSFHHVNFHFLIVLSPRHSISNCVRLVIEMTNSLYVYWTENKHKLSWRFWWQEKRTKKNKFSLPSLKSFTIISPLCENAKKLSRNGTT